MGDFLNQLRVLATTRDPQEFARILFSPLSWFNPQPESTDENQSEYVLVPARNPLNLFANPNQENENQRLDALNMYQLIGIIRAHREADIASNGITNADFRNYYEQSRQELNQAWQNYLRHPDNNGNRVNFMRSLRQHEQVLSDLRDVADFLTPINTRRNRRSNPEITRDRHVNDLSEASNGRMQTAAAIRDAISNRPNQPLQIGDLFHRLVQPRAIDRALKNINFDVLTRNTELVLSFSNIQFAAREVSRQLDIYCQGSNGDQALRSAIRIYNENLARFGRINSIETQQFEITSDMLGEFLTARSRMQRSNGDDGINRRVILLDNNNPHPDLSPAEQRSILRYGNSIEAIRRTLEPFLKTSIPNILDTGVRHVERLPEVLARLANRLGNGGRIAGAYGMLVLPELGPLAANASYRGVTGEEMPEAGQDTVHTSITAGLFATMVSSYTRAGLSIPRASFVSLVRLGMAAVGIPMVADPVEAGLSRLGINVPQSGADRSIFNITSATIYVMLEHLAIRAGQRLVQAGISGVARSAVMAIGGALSAEAAAPVLVVLGAIAAFAAVGVGAAAAGIGYFAYLMENDEDFREGVTYLVQQFTDNNELTPEDIETALLEMQNMAEFLENDLELAHQEIEDA